MADPTSVANLLAWYKAGVGLYKDAGGTLPVSADGDSIALWKDQSGNGYDLTQATAAAQMKWDATRSLVQNEFNAAEKMSIPAGMAYNSRAFSIAFIGQLVTLRDAYNNGNQTTHVLHESSGNNANAYYSRGAIFHTYDGTTVQNTAALSSVHTSPCLIVYSFGATGTTIYVNGTSVATLPVMANIAATGGIFGGDSTQSWSLQAAISDVAYYSRAITSGDVSTLLTYAQSRIVPGGFTVNVGLDGDSITAGAGNTLNRNWPNQLGLASNVRTVNFAESSLPLATMVTEAATLVDPWIVGGQTNILVVFAGVNDFFVNSATEAATYTNLKNYCTARKAAGWNKVIACTMLPCKLGGTFTQANWQAYNTDIIANASAAYDAVADVTSDSRIGAWGANTNTTYYASDQIHPNNIGSAIIAGIVKPKIQQFLPVAGVRINAALMDVAVAGALALVFE